jgi:DNA-binding transcriptional ArsR family regulator
MNDIDPEILEECRQISSSWAPILRALANEERLLIVLWLAESVCTVRELENVTGLSQSLVSYHLRALRDAGLVTATARGRSNEYALSHSDLTQLATVIGRLKPVQIPRIETN